MHAPTKRELRPKDAEIIHAAPTSFSSFVCYPSVHLYIPSTVSSTMPLLSTLKHLIPCASSPESSAPAESGRREGGRNAGSAQVRTAVILEHGSQRFRWIMASIQDDSSNFSWPRLPKEMKVPSLWVSDEYSMAVMTCSLPASDLLA